MSQRAIASFEASGFGVISVNADTEVAQLAPLYPTVAFKGSGTLNGVIPGRYGPTFTALFAACREGSPNAIINADTYMIGSNLLEHLAQNPETFLVARRADVGGEDGSYLGTYSRGIDAVFFLPDRFAPVLLDEDLGRFQLGAPFWDVAIPVVASFHGVVEFIRPPFLLHAVHKANWSEADYDVLRLFASNAVLRHARANAATSPNARKFVEMAEALTGARDAIVTRKDAKAVTRLVDAWLKRLEHSQSVRLAVDLADPILRAATGSDHPELEQLAALESSWGDRKPPSSGLLGAIRSVLRRRRLARQAKRWNRLFNRHFPPEAVLMSAPSGRGRAPSKP
jgi:hypothetical protein